MAEIQGGGTMPHQQLPMHHHRVQMVMNHHMDLDCHQTEIHPANISKFNKFFFAFCLNRTFTEKYIELLAIDVLENVKVVLFTKQTDVTVLIMLKEKNFFSFVCTHIRMLLHRNLIFFQLSMCIKSKQSREYLALHVHYFMMYVFVLNYMLGDIDSGQCEKIFFFVKMPN